MIQRKCSVGADSQKPQVKSHTIPSHRGIRGIRGTRGTRPIRPIRRQGVIDVIEGADTMFIISYI